ncbi:MAG: radical SAM protein [Myxococcales bacterium]|nr:radical SAM protein [Myxococcales bacterium]
MARSFGLRLASPCDLACAACDRGGSGTPIERATEPFAGSEHGDELRILGCDPLSLPGLSSVIEAARARGCRRVAVETNGAGLATASLDAIDELSIPELMLEPEDADLLFGRPGAQARLELGLRRWSGAVRLRVPILAAGFQDPHRALARRSNVVGLELHLPGEAPDAARAAWLRFPDKAALSEALGRVLDAALEHGVEAAILPRSGLPFCAVPERHRHTGVLRFDRTREAELGPRDRYSPACEPCVARRECSGFRAWQLTEWPAGAVEPLTQPIAAPASLAAERGAAAPGKTRGRFRVVLANLVERTFGYGPGAAEYLRAALLTAPALRDRVEVDVQLMVNVPTARAAEQLLALEPDLLGMSTYSWNLQENARVCSELRRLGADFPIVWGGPSFALFARDSSWFEAGELIDAVAIGSGEQTLVQLTRQLIERGRLDGPLAGLALFSEGRPVFGGATQEPLELGEVASPFVIGVAHRVERPTIEMARGCSFECSFCSDARSSRGGGLREHTLERISADIAAVTGWPEARHVDAGASTANVTDAFFRRVCDAIRAGDPGGKLSYGFQLYPSLASDAQRAALEGIRVDTIHLGVQSLSRDTFRSMRRGSRASFVERALATFRGVGPLELSVILGLPGETYGSFVDTFEQLLAHSEARLVVNRLLVLPGTAYHLRRRELGLELDPTKYFRVLSTPTLSREDLRRAQDYVIERTLGLSDLFHQGEARVRWVNFDAQARFGDPPEYAQGR